MLSKKNRLIWIALTIFALVSCDKSKEEKAFLWGESDCYEDFLWHKYVPDTLTQTLCFDFSEDAVRYMSEPLKLGVYKKNEDGDLVLVGDDEMQLFVNSVQQDTNCIVVAGTEKTLEIGIVLNSRADDKTHYWYIKPINSFVLDRVNGEETTDEIVVLEMKVRKGSVMNPLSKICLFVLCVFALLMLLWICLLRPIFFNSFSLKKVNVYVGDTMKTIQLAGKHKVILTCKNKHQNGLVGFFTGSIIYFTNDFFSVGDIVLSPKDKKSIRINLSKGYDSSDTHVRKGETVTIKKRDSKEIAKITI